MRRPVDTPRVEAFMERLGGAARVEGAVYLTGGATAVLLGRRRSTVDIDLKLVPDDDACCARSPG
jgi:hypothetical protein